MNNELYVYGSDGPIAQADNVLNGKKWAACGDSITAGTSSGEQDELGRWKNYAWFIATRNNMNYINDGVSGSTLTNSGGQNSFSVQRYLDVPKDCDYITLWFGINDMASATIGTIDDATNTTFYGAWNVVLTYFLNNMPSTTKIGLVVSHGINASIREAVINIAKKYGLKTFDIEGDPYIPYWFGRTTEVGNPSADVVTLRKSQWFADHIHPNKAGYEYISTAFEAWLRSL